MSKPKKLSIFSLTWPIFLEILLFMLMGNMDVFMLSQYSDDAVAAVGVANQFLQVALVMFGFVSAGTAVIISQYIGAKKIKVAKQVSAVAIVSSLVLGLIVSLVFILAPRALLTIMDLPDALMAEAQFFIMVVGGFIFIQSVLATMGAILRSYGYTRDMLLVTATMNILNVGINAIVIFGLFGVPVLGVPGVAVGTAICKLVGLMIAIAILLKRIGNPFQTIKFKQFPVNYVKQIFRIGLPAAGENLSYSGYQLMLIMFITAMGTVALTTRIYTRNINMFIFLFTIALAQGIQIILGQLMGAKQYDEIYKRCYTYLKAAIMVSTLGAIVCYFLAGPILSIFTDNQEVIATGRLLFLLTIILEPGRAINIIVIFALRATGDVKFPVYVGIIFMWGIGVAFGYLFGVVFGWGLVGIMIAMIMDEWFRGILMLIRWRSRIWQTKGIVSETAS